MKPLGSASVYTVLLNKPRRKRKEFRGRLRKKEESLCTKIFVILTAGQRRRKSKIQYPSQSCFCKNMRRESNNYE